MAVPAALPGLTEANRRWWTPVARSPLTKAGSRRDGRENALDGHQSVWPPNGKSPRVSHKTGVASGGFKTIP